MLPLFNFDTTVTADQGRQDHLDITMNLGKLEGTTNQIDRFRKALCPVAEDGFPECLTSHGWIFNRPRQRNTYRHEQEIRTRKARGDGSVASPPLFSGKLAYGGYYRRHMNDITEASLLLKLNCNPTRFARFSPPRPDGAEPANDLFGESAPVPEDGEVSTDGKDNWIPAGPHDDYYSPSRWRWHVVRYIREIREAVEQDIRTAKNLADTEKLGRVGPLYTFRRVETYWEFLSPNPMAVVCDIDRLMSGFCSGGSRTKYNGNFASYRYQIARGVELCVYAKTNRRIRVEVRHDLSENIPPTVAQRTASSFIGFRRILEACRVEGCDVVNNMFAHLRSRGSIAKSHVNEALLMVRIGRIIKDDSLAVMIVETLRARGGIAPDKKSAPLRKGLDRLQYGGVLQWDAASGLYVPTSDHAHAAMTLRSRRDSLSLYPKRHPQGFTPTPAATSAYPKRNASKKAAASGSYPKRNPIPPS